MKVTSRHLIFVPCYLLRWAIRNDLMGLMGPVCRVSAGFRQGVVWAQSAGCRLALHRHCHGSAAGSAA